MTPRMPLVAPRDWPPPSSTVVVEVAAKSWRGPRRPVNTDHFLVAQLDRRFETLMTSCPEDEIPAAFNEHGYGLVVADGMGAGPTGEIASRLAIASLAHLALYFGKWNLRIDPVVAKDVIDRVERFYRYVDGMLIRSSDDEQGETLQSTLTAALSAGEDLFIAHVGHSRLYLFRDEKLVRLTRDHTIAERPPATPLEPQAAFRRNMKHVVTSTLGGGDRGPDIDVEKVSLADGDILLLCTNGLTDSLSDQWIGSVLGSEDFLDDKCRRLVELAFDAGATDDVTALLARYEIPNHKRAGP